MKRNFNLFAIFLVFISTLAFADQKTEVIKIIDGDTFTVLSAGRPEKIRLFGIDCPEKNQAYGEEAKNFTSKFIKGKTIKIVPVTFDLYGRSVSIVYIDGKCINEELLKAGLAWHFERYSKKPKWKELCRKAKLNKSGLWLEDNPTPPWEYRKKRKKYWRYDSYTKTWKEVKPHKESTIQRPRIAEIPNFSSSSNTNHNYNPSQSTRSNKLPSLDQSKSVKVKGYYRKDGTYVRPHTRKRQKR